MPTGYVTRPARADDVDAVAGVLIADDLDAWGRTDYDADFVRDQWSLPGFDPSTDAWCVEAPDGTVIAYAQVRTEEVDRLAFSWGAVHPEHRGLGIGSLLLERIERRAAELSGGSLATLRHATTANDEGAAALLWAHGFHRVRRFWHMEIDLTSGDLAEPRPPAGIEVRSVETAEDVRAVHRVTSEAFLDHWDYRPEPFEDWLTRVERSPAHEPGLWLLALREDEPIGALTAEVRPGAGWITDLGVLPAWRRRGVATVLLRRTFAVFARRGLQRAMLGVDSENPTGATTLYEQAGMRVATAFDLYDEPLA